MLRDRRDRPQPPGLGRAGEGALQGCAGGGRARGQAAEARQPRPLHARGLREAVREREQLRHDLRRASRGARVRPRRVRGAAGVLRGARDHLLRDRLRLRQRGLPRGARHARVQARVRRPDEHAAPPPRGPDREARDLLHRRRHDGRRPARARHAGLRERPDRRPPVHRGLSGRVERARPRRDRHLSSRSSRRRSSASRATTTGSRWRSPPSCSAPGSSRSTSP